MEFLTALVILSFLWIATYFTWRSRFNAGLAVLIAWTPAILLVRTPYHFISGTYANLNFGMSTQADMAVLLAYCAFFLGVISVPGAKRRFSRLGSYQPGKSMMEGVSESRLWLLFFIGLSIFLYAFKSANLSAVLQTDAAAEDVYESRLAFHLGPISHLVLLLDITFVVFVAKFLEQGKWRHLAPALISLVCYAATLQKSRVMFLVVCTIYLAFLYPPQVRFLLFGTFLRKCMSFIAVFFVFAALAISNLVRGMGVFRFMDYESPIMEQLFIYSGAPAILNFSSMFDGRITADPPGMGRIFFRAVFWPFVDRDTLNPSRYLEGINNGTALAFYWQDFRVWGLPVLCFVLGMILTICFVMSLRRSVFGLMLGCFALNAAVFSVYTEVMLEPATIIVLALSYLVQLFVRDRGAARRAKAIVDDSQPLADVKGAS